MTRASIPGKTVSRGLLRNISQTEPKLKQVQNVLIADLPDLSIKRVAWLVRTVITANVVVDKL